MIRLSILNAHLGHASPLPAVRHICNTWRGGDAGAGSCIPILLQVLKDSRLHRLISANARNWNGQGRAGRRYLGSILGWVEGRWHTEQWVGVQEWKTGLVSDPSPFPGQSAVVCGCLEPRHSFSMKTPEC